MLTSNIQHPTFIQPATSNFRISKSSILQTQSSNRKARSRARFAGASLTGLLSPILSSRGGEGDKPANGWKTWDLGFGVWVVGFMLTILSAPEIKAATETAPLPRMAARTNVTAKTTVVAGKTNALAAGRQSAKTNAPAG